jgi:hypothetical protein
VKPDKEKGLEEVAVEQGMVLRAEAKTKMEARTSS